MNDTVVPNNNFTFALNLINFPLKTFKQHLEHKIWAHPMNAPTSFTSRIASHRICHFVVVEWYLGLPPTQFNKTFLRWQFVLFCSKEFSEKLHIKTTMVSVYSLHYEILFDGWKNEVTKSLSRSDFSINVSLCVTYNNFIGNTKHRKMWLLLKRRCASSTIDQYRIAGLNERT